MLSRRFVTRSFSRLASTNARNCIAPAAATTTTTRSFAKRSNPGDQKKQASRKPDEKEVEEKLAWVENRLQQAELDQKYGKKRGEEQIRKLLKEESTKNRRINRNMIVTEIKTLLYMRHALQHGALRLKDLVKGGKLGKSFLGEDSKENISPQHAKTILLEEFRYGKSSLLETYIQKHEKRNEQKRSTQKQQKAAALKRQGAAEQKQTIETQRDEEKHMAD